MGPEAPVPGLPGLFRGRHGYQPRTPWAPLAAILATIAIVIAGAAGAGLLLQSTGRPTAASSQEAAQVLSALAAWQVIVVLLAFVASALRGNPADVLALRAPNASSAVYVQALLLMLLLQVVVVAVQRGTGADDVFADLRPMVQLVSGETWVLALLVVGLGAPLAEELLFRGFLLSALAKSRLGFTGAAVLTSVGWTALHAGYTPRGLIEVFVIGLFFSWLLWRTGSLRVAIVCHALYNSFIVLVLQNVTLPA